jgi:ribosome-associated translation inhibitor RaiA
MNLPDFEFEFHHEAPLVDEGVRAETEDRLRRLADGHRDMIGASVATDYVAPYEYRARVVVYMRPENLTAEEKDDSAETALRSAVHSIERQVRSQREKRREFWRRA